MYAFYVSGNNITEKVERKSLRIQEQLNNRRNTASFRLLDDFQVQEGQEIEIYKQAKIKSRAGNIIFLQSESEWQIKNRFFIGQKIHIRGSETEHISNITNLDYNQGSITLQSIPASLDISGKEAAIKIFGGIVTDLPDENIGKSPILEKRVQCLDHSFMLQKRNVVDTYEDMYTKEILSRSLYRFTARDKTKILADFEGAETITKWGIATDISYSTENIQGNQSLNVGATGAGAGGYTITIPSTDITNLDAVRLWIKLSESIQEDINFIVLKVGQNGSNHYRYERIFEKGDLWSWENWKTKQPTATTGNPNPGAITWISFDFVAKKAITSGNIKIDEISATKGGYTTQNIERGEIKHEDIRSQYRTPDDFIEILSKLEGFFWYIDEEKDIHFFSSLKHQNNTFIINPLSQNYNDLKRKIDITKLKNRQTIRGGIAPAENEYIQEYETDGLERSWRFDYPPKQVVLEIDEGSGYQQKTVGVENLVDETTVDYVFNFNEKTLRAGVNTATLAAGTKIRFTYIPYKDIRVRYQDNESIAKLKAATGGDGVYDGAVINDNSIRTFAEARNRARAEIKAYKNPIITITFTTDQENLKPGELISIEDENRGIKDKFLIQSVTTISKGLDTFTYSVSCASTMFGYIEFFQLLFRRTEKGLVDVNELVDIIQNVNETIDIEEKYTLIKKGHIFYAMGPSPGETPNDAYADFSQTS